jgi:uncharacterized protein
MDYALITGASMGIGAEIARVFAENGHNLVLVARSSDKLERLARHLHSAHGVTVRVEVVDLVSPTNRDALFQRLDNDGIAVRYLVNNAGFGTNGRFVDQSRRRELQQISLNVSALTDTSHHFLKSMLESGQGAILNIASTAGFQPGPYMAVYYATKAYVISFTEALHEELRGTGVTATAYCPGATESEFARISGNGESKLFKYGNVASTSSVASDAYRSMIQGKAISVHGAANWIGAFSIRFFPRRWVRAVTALINTP